MEQPVSQKKKILIVEDEKPMGRALSLKLTNLGFDVKNANNGEEGLALMEQETFDLVLLDLIMPKMDGFTLLQNMKAKNIQTPSMVLSNLSQEEDEKKAKALGAQGFFIKSDTPIKNIVEEIKKILPSSS